MTAVTTKEFLKGFKPMTLNKENKIVSHEDILRITQPTLDQATIRSRSVLFYELCKQSMYYTSNDKFLKLYRIRDTHPLVYIEASWTDYKINELENILERLSIEYSTVTENVDRYINKVFLQGLNYPGTEVLIVDITHMKKIKRKKLIKLRKKLTKLNAMVIFVSNDKKKWANLKRFDIIVKKNVIIKRKQECM